MARPCSNDNPCLQWGPGAHSAVCRTLVTQGAKPKALPGSRHVATLAGRAPAKLARLPDGSILVAQSDAAPRSVGKFAPDALPPIEAVAELVPGTIHFASPDRRVGCGCGRVVLRPEAWAGEAKNGWEQDGVLHRYSKPCKPIDAEAPTVTEGHNKEKSMTENLNQIPAASVTRYDIPPEMHRRLDNAFRYHPPKGDQAQRYELVREMAKGLAVILLELTPPGREQSLAMTKLEEVTFWANAAIARGEK